MSKLSMVLGAVFGIGMVVASAAGLAFAAGGPTTYYAQFDSAQVTGLMQVDLTGGNTAHVTARIKEPSEGLVAFCLTTADGQNICQTVNPDQSGFDKSTQGCADFDMEFSEPVTDAAITDITFVNVLDRVPMTPDKPNGIGQLNVCRK